MEINNVHSFFFIFYDVYASFIFLISYKIFIILAPNPAEVDAFQTILNHEIQKVQTRLEEFAQYMKDLKVR